MQAGDLVQANKFANWSARHAKIGFVLEVIHRRNDVELTIVRILFGDCIKALPANHFEVIS